MSHKIHVRLHNIDGKMRVMFRMGEDAAAELTPYHIRYIERADLPFELNDGNNHLVGVFRTRQEAEKHAVMRYRMENGLDGGHEA